MFVRGRLGRLTVVVAALLASTFAAACDTKPPPPVLTVNVADEEPDAGGQVPGDANPGDGVCEITVGAGDCSLRAAIDEANASSDPTNPTRIEVEPGTPGLPPAGLFAGIEVTGAMRIVYLGPQPPDILTEGVVFGGPVHIAPGAQLAIEGMTIRALDNQSTSSPGFLVDGSLLLVRSTVRSETSFPLVHVDAGGQAVVANSYVAGFSAEAVQNEGLVVLDHVTAISYLAPSILSTAPGARSILRSTAILAPGVGRVPPGLAPACAGEPVESLGYNAAWDGTCQGLTSIGDVPDLPGQVPPVDTIPLGTAGCGAPGDVDRLGTPRPVDSDGDGVAACDIGADEVPAPA
ncbi:MAG: hypothetical protein KF906_00655 [Actinobacteria bacterium]|nr:hypothetical protein [Actinomycetota bacterium]